MQATNNILIIKPSSFCFNIETAASNLFQVNTVEDIEIISKKVDIEFNEFVALLEENNINIHLFNDTILPPKPDAIFPNNWISFHENGKVIIYPMCTPNRRFEKRFDIINTLKSNFIISEVIDLSFFELQEKYLEGTGSIVFDHDNKLAYACTSPRTNNEILAHLCEQLQYKTVVFNAVDENGIAIYHTNVMMSIGTGTVTICLESIKDKKERELVVATLQKTKTIVDISFTQMKAFAGNMLQLKNNINEDIIVLSKTAYESLTHIQKNMLEKFAKLTPINIPTIETIGGGSIRCMIAEIFCSKK